jgi:hypothetical protein
LAQVLSPKGLTNARRDQAKNKVRCTNVRGKVLAAKICEIMQTPKKCARSTAGGAEKVRGIDICKRTFFTLGKVLFSAKEVKRLEKVREIINVPLDRHTCSAFT